MRGSPAICVRCRRSLRRKKFSAIHKSEREFYRTAAAKILCDTPEITVIEYFNKAKIHIAVHIFTRIVRQRSLTVYPFTESDEYYCGDRIYKAEELRESGVTVEIGTNCGREIVLLKKV